MEINRALIVYFFLLLFSIFIALLYCIVCLWTSFSLSGCLTPPEAAKVVLPLLKGLNFLHNTCLIIHRDIKPEVRTE
jgi:serine/threonine protein kinase